MSEPSRGFKWASALWAVLLGIGIIALAGSILMPSTKRARVDWDEVRRVQAEEEAAEAAAAATLPSTIPSTAPVESAARVD
jgi:hypothetical protein